MRETKIDTDKDFRQRRETARRADNAALASRSTTPQLLQQQNSMFPANIRERVQIDWHHAAHGTHVQP